MYVYEVAILNFMCACIFNIECEKAVQKCLAKIPLSASIGNITHTTQSTSQVTVTTSAGDSKPGMELYTYCMYI